MQRFYDPDGETIAFSNGAMWTLYFALYSVVAGRRPTETEEEEAVSDWLHVNWTRADDYAIAFSLDPVEPEIATPRRLAYLAELMRIAADDLAHDGAPDEMIWNGEIAWEPERQAHWLDRLDELAWRIERARYAMVTAPRPGAG